MTPEALVDRLRARGLELVTDGQRVGVRPAGALTDEERAALRAHRVEVLRLLPNPRQAWRPTFTLCPQTVAEVLGDTPNPHDLAILKLDVWSALATVAAEVATGAIGSEPLVVRGLPLADWVSLDTIAELLKAGARWPGAER